MYLKKGKSRKFVSFGFCFLVTVVKYICQGKITNLAQCCVAAYSLPSSTWAVTSALFRECDLKK